MTSSVLSGRRNRLSSRLRLGGRPHATFPEEGFVEVFVRLAGDDFLVRRTFRPITRAHRGDTVVVGRDEQPHAHRFDLAGGDFVATEGYSFLPEVCKQGRFHRPRDVVQRPPAMLDELAQLGPVKQTRADLASRILETGRLRKPHDKEQEALPSALADLPALEAELANDRS